MQAKSGIDMMRLFGLTEQTGSPRESKYDTMANKGF